MRPNPSGEADASVKIVNHATACGGAPVTLYRQAHMGPRRNE